ncbi:MAG: 6-bladed beta-propeller [Candidatus Aminicenantes bacterium]|nr:MAG: 6-bladed beta-propeller [Candidatus Aminicenantes bacterium]
MMRTGPRVGFIAMALVLSLSSFAAGPTQVLWSVTSFGHDDYFQEPSDIEIDRSKSMIYVVDAGSARVLVFDFTGRFKQAIGRKGQGPGEFTRPTGACLTGGGGLAVADFGANRIEIFDPAGRFVRLVNVTESRVADLVQAGGKFYTVPASGMSGYAIATGSDAKSQPLVNVLDEEGKKVLEIVVDDFPEPHPFIRAIKHRASLALSPDGRLFLAYFAANLIQVFDQTGVKVGTFTRPLPFKPAVPALVAERSPEQGVVQMRAELDFVSPAAEFGPDGMLYVLTVTEALAQIRKTNPELKDPYPMRIDIVDARTFQAVRTVPCDPGIKAFAVLDGGRLVYVCEDAEGELALKCVKY